MVSTILTPLETLHWIFGLIFQYAAQRHVSWRIKMSYFIRRLVKIVALCLLTLTRFQWYWILPRLLPGTDCFCFWEKWPAGLICKKFYTYHWEIQYYTFFKRYQGNTLWNKKMHINRSSRKAFDKFTTTHFFKHFCVSNSFKTNSTFICWSF